MRKLLIITLLFWGAFFLLASASPQRSVEATLDAAARNWAFAEPDHQLKQQLFLMERLRHWSTEAEGSAASEPPSTERQTVNSAQGQGDPPLPLPVQPRLP